MTDKEVEMEFTGTIEPEGTKFDSWADEGQVAYYARGKSADRRGSRGVGHNARRLSCAAQLERPWHRGCT